MLRAPSGPPVNVGDVLASKYRVEGVLGMGGMGVVVAATHLDLEQKVALKFLLPTTAADPVIVERFLREARASVRLKSPHVARTLDTGRLENGCPFIVMELLEGRDLAAEVDARGTALPVDEAASYVLQACDALAEAHAAGIVHRDLKPANLFLARGHDGRPQVKVLDFGISKMIPAANASGPVASMTATDSVFGSPAYMSPEQMRSSKEVDARTDLWSVGVVLYELVTGRLPFEAPTALEIGLKASQDEPPRPKMLRPDLPDGFERIILRCLEKAPSQRFASVAELAQALTPFAHPRDRGIAERVRDIASAASSGGRLASDARGPDDSRRSLDATSDPRQLGLDATQLALDETQLASDNARVTFDRTQPAVSADARKEPRGIGRSLVVAAVVALAGAAIVIVPRLGGRTGSSPADPATLGAASTTASTEGAPAADMPPGASSALPLEEPPASGTSDTRATATVASAPPAIVPRAPQLATATSRSRPVAPSSASAPAATAGGTPDAGRFFRVRE